MAAGAEPSGQQHLPLPEVAVRIASVANEHLIQCFPQWETTSAFERPSYVEAMKVVTNHHRPKLAAIYRELKALGFAPELVDRLSGY